MLFRSTPPATATGTPPATATGTPTAIRRELLHWRNAVFAIFLLSGLCVASWVSRVPAVRDDLQLNTAEVGLLIFGMSAGSVLGLVAATWMLARLGARNGMVAAIGTTALGLITVGVSASAFESFPGAFIGLALVGFGMGSVDVMMNVEGAAAEREIGRTLMPLMHACFSFGTVIGALLGDRKSVV